MFFKVCVLCVGWGVVNLCGKTIENQGAAPQRAPQGLQVQGAWARLSPGRNGACYVSCSATKEDRLLSVAAEPGICERTELHIHVEKDGVLAMRPIKEGLLVTPRAPLEMKPGGVHIMLIKLKQPLKKGMHFAVSLMFEKAGELVVPVSVCSPLSTQLSNEIGSCCHEGKD